MPILPFVALWTVLAAAVVLSAVLQSQPRLRFPLTIGATLIAVGLWLWAGSPAPELLPSATFLGYSWTISLGVWQLTGMVLLVLLTATTAGWVYGSANGSADFSLMLALGFLPFVWAGDPLTAAAMLSLAIGAWLLVLWRSGGFEQAGRPLVRQLALLLLTPLLLIWFADAIAVGGTAEALWVELAGAAVLIAGALLLGAWPAAHWREAALRGSPASAIALMTLPPIAGATVLLPVAQQSVAGGAQTALAVVVGFAALLLGLRWAWQPAARSAMGSVALAGALAGLVVLTAVFSSESALLAATRVAVFAPLVLLLISRSAGVTGVETYDEVVARAGGWSGWVEPAAMLIAWMAVLGMPLTAGFAAITALYVTWQVGASWLLVAILVILLIAWSAAVSHQIWRRGQLARQGAGLLAAGPAIRGIVPLLLPLLALIAIDLPTLSATTPITWLALLAPLVFGPLVAWLLDGRLDVQEVVATPLLPRDALMPVTSRAGQWRTAVADALSEALAIIEGPSGLLWILLVIVLLILVTVV